MSTTAPSIDTAGAARLELPQGWDAGIAWERRDARIIDHRDNSVAFEQLSVEVPATWSQNATNILAQKYLRGRLGTAEREDSLRQVVARIVGTIAAWGSTDGYFPSSETAEHFAVQLARLLCEQRAAFNSPVWFNIGVAGAPQQASACFILSVEDTMDSILDWYGTEGRVFKGGSGAGVNLSRIRASCEPLAGGGTASGPVSFMRGADASAGTIKSGGKTRRAAKMVILDVDHPDIEEFIWCKAREENKSRTLAAAGFDMGIDGKDAPSVQYQNANNSVRVTDAFMEAATAGERWQLLNRLDGSVASEVDAAQLLHAIAEASWACADPGVQFHDTINLWHTTPTAGEITASNPCSEYMHLNNSACNLASINLLAFLNDAGRIDIDALGRATGVLFTAQDILVGRAHYPTDPIAANTRSYRQLGLGYANLGALLMAMGWPYDSDAGRAHAAALTAYICGCAYLASTALAARVELGPFAGYSTDSQAMLKVLSMHRDAIDGINSDRVPAYLLDAARQVWQTVCDVAPTTGVRNSQATVLAPTGTIGLLMDCDTTGIEPDLALVKTKRLVGGGTMQIVNQTVPRALDAMGYDSADTTAILAHIEKHRNAQAPELKTEHRKVFQCSLGEDPITAAGHVEMMAAVQPFLSGAISKTVNMPADSTVEDVEELIVRSWTLGLKSLAIYRDGSKVAQPLQAAPKDTPQPEPVRRPLPRSRRSRTFEFRLADCKGFVTAGEYADGSPGEIFVKVSKQGSTLAGIMDAFAISLSHGLQYGVPLSAYITTFTGVRFEPAGITDDPDIRFATSLMDYIFRRLALEYLSPSERQALSIYTTTERSQPTLPTIDEQITGLATDTAAPSLLHLEAPAPVPALLNIAADAPFCGVCGIPMQRAGSCFLCGSCGNTSGCS